MDEPQSPSFISQLIVFLLIICIVGVCIKCAIVIQKGIIRDAVIEAIQQTKVKL